MNVLGIDIGTTTICVCAIDAASGKTQKAVTVNSESFIKSGRCFEKIQSVEIIENKVNTLLKEILSQCTPVCAIGVTGQMHGIVYVDRDGAACSPLYTWQDLRAGEIYKDGKTYTDEIFALTGSTVPAGYGLATHFYNLKNGLVPENAASVCTIHDYISMRLCGKNRALMHTSDAASFGLFDLKNKCFDSAAIKKLGIDVSLLPEVTPDETQNGVYCGIPVSVAIGDNQASFLGSVADTDNHLLINIGTGSQISVKGKTDTVFPSGEVRPLTGDDSILVGSALCGGRVYACLEAFFRETVRLYNGSNDKMYEFMDKIADENYPIDNALLVDTAFSGKRSNPDVRGKIENICTDNLTPAHLILGVLKGSVCELYNMYAEISESLEKKPTVLVGSGNGLRKSKTWRKICEDVFGMKLCVPAHSEEAAYGAAVFSLAASKIYPSLKAAQKIIKYSGDEND